jgi:hypothetical protein
MKSPSPLARGLAFCFLAIAIVSAPAAADGKSIPLWNRKDLSGWKKVGNLPLESWKVGNAALDPADPTKLVVSGPGQDLVAPAKAVNLSSEASFGDCRVEVEFMVSKGSNSGIKLQNIYEIQIFDSFGKAKVGPQDCGAVYMESAPRVNASKGPGEWQTLVIEFRAPRFDAAGKKTANAKFVKVTLNGQVVQENVEVPHGTNVSRNAPEHPTGPIYVQGDHGPVAFRKLTVSPLSE